MEGLPALEPFFNLGLGGVLLFVILFVSWRYFKYAERKLEMQGTKRNNPDSMSLLDTVIKENTKAVRENTGELKKLCQFTHDSVANEREHHTETREAHAKILEKLP